MFYSLKFSAVATMEAVPSETVSNVLKPSDDVESQFATVKGYDFNEGVDYARILESYATTGFQATHFAQAIEVSSLLPVCQLYTSFGKFVLFRSSKACSRAENVRRAILINNFHIQRAVK